MKTIGGLEVWLDRKSVTPPLIADVSSTILLAARLMYPNSACSYRRRAEEYRPHGLVVVIVRERPAGARRALAVRPMLDYQCRAKNGSMYKHNHRPLAGPGRPDPSKWVKEAQKGPAGKR